MKADYKNWMPQGMINGFAAAVYDSLDDSYASCFFL